MTEVEKIKYKNVDRYNSVLVLADKMWPLCTLDSWSEFHKKGNWTSCFTGWISITTGWIINDEIQVFVGWSKAAV